MTHIKLLCTTDLHSYIYPYRYSDNKVANLGLAKLSAKINALKDENTLVLDNGDVLQGSSLSFYHYAKEKDQLHPMVNAFNYMQYDYINIGNHDFNYGTEDTFKFINNVKAPCITSNFLYKGEPVGPTYVVRTLPNRKKIALFGLVTKYIPNWELPEHIKDCEFLDPVEVAKKTVELIKKFEKVDYIVCLYHGGMERDFDGNILEPLTGENQGYELTKIDGLDILLSGHQHKDIAGFCNGTLVLQSIFNGVSMEYVDIDCDTNEISYEIIHAGDEVDENLLKVMDDVNNRTQKWLDEPLGKTTMDLKVIDEHEGRVHKHPIVSLINQIQLDKSNADITATALFNDATGFNEVITMRDVVSTYMFPNTLFVKKINGRQLKEFLEKSANFFEVKNGVIGVAPDYDYPKPMHFNYDMVDGIEYTIKAGNPRGNRIFDMMYKGKPVTDDMEFTFALNNYRANGGGDYFMMQECELLKEFPEDMVEIVATYIMNHPVLEVNHKENIKVII